MLKKLMLSLSLTILLGNGFWTPAPVHALYVTLKCASGYTYINGVCVKTGSVEVEGTGNTQGANTTAYAVVKPDNSQGVILVCRNRGGNVGSGQAFLPSDINLSGTDAEKPNLVDKKGKFTFASDSILPAGIHPEYTPEECTDDTACAAIQLYCPNGGYNGNDGKNWVPIDVTPIALKVQAFLYYCDSDKGVHICPCDPKLDAQLNMDGLVLAEAGPANRCASATSSTKTTTSTSTFAWPNTDQDGTIDHYDILPAAKTVVYSCVLPNPQDWYYGASLPYSCAEDTTSLDLFPGSKP